MIRTHGSTTLNYADNIIRAEFVGAYNAHGVQNFFDSLKRLVADLDGQAFAILIDNRRLEGGTPEAYAVLEQYNQWLNTQNLVAKAMLIESAVNLAIIDSLSPSRQQQTIQSFAVEGEAVAWLQKMLGQHHSL